jgi:hypothetical protein
LPLDLRAVVGGSSSWIRHSPDWGSTKDHAEVGETGVGAGFGTGLFGQTCPGDFVDDKWHPLMEDTQRVAGQAKLSR